MVFKWHIRRPLTSKWWPPQWHWKHLTTLFPMVQCVSVMAQWFGSNEFFFLFLFYLLSLGIALACKIWKVSCICSLYQNWSSFFWLLFILFWIIFYWFFFNFIPSYLVSFDFYIKFGPHSIYCYLFIYLFFNWFLFSI